MYKSIIFSILILCVFSSCFKERITPNYNTEDNKKIVITGWVSTLDQAQYINVSRTVNYLGGFTPDMVSGAVVTLEDSQNTYALEEKEAGFYYLPDDWSPRVGDDYKLKVNFENQEYTASHKMRPCPEIEDLDYEMIEDDSLTYFEPYFSFQEIPGEGDAYFGIDYLSGTQGDSLVNGGFADDQFADGQYLTDIYLEGYEYQLGDTAVIDFYSIGLETAEYLQDIESEIYRGSPFDAPPANVRTNITGGAVGYFIISDARRERVVIE